MPDYTATHEIPYSVGSEPVQSVDETMQELAERLDELATAHGRHAAGTVGGLVVGAGGGTASQAVVFPAGRFTATPKVLCQITSGLPAAGASGSGANAWAYPSGESATGFTINYRRGAADTGTVNWHAVQS